MFPNRMRLLFFIAGVAVFIAIFLHSENTKKLNPKNAYLLTPSGHYGVGYQDVEVLNKNICPDPFYKPGVNEADFSQNNPQHCHAIILRIYYPSVNPITIGDKYYRPAFSEENSLYVKKYKLTEAEEKRLNSNEDIETYTKHLAEPIHDKKFPIIIFMPGSGQSVHTYNNIVSDLVSNGYVVVGVNSTFANGSLLLPNGHLIPHPEIYNDAGRLENLNDLMTIVDQLPTLPYQLHLDASMNFTSIGLLGHSMGAMNIAYFLEQNKNNNMKAAVLMDPGNVLKNNYPLAPISLPTLVMWSSYFKSVRNASISLGKNNYTVELTDNTPNHTFSNHENFSDASTLQYHPAYQIPKIHNAITNSDYMGIGYGNGFEISSDINEYILKFFDLHLKKISSEVFFKCKSIVKNSKLQCAQ